MTTELLSSPDDGRPRRRLPRAMPALIVVVGIAVAVTALIVQHNRANERRAARLAILDDANVRASITGGETGTGNARLDIAVVNAGGHQIVLGEASILVPGVRLQSALTGAPIAAGATLTDELQLRITCPAAADARSGGQVLIPYTTAAKRRHLIRLAIDPDPLSPDGEPMHIIRSVCGAIDASDAISFIVLKQTQRADGLDITAEVSNAGRSPLQVRAIRFGDDRLALDHLALPIKVAPRAHADITLRVTARQCGPEVNHADITVTVVGSNEDGESAANISDDELDRAFRALIARRCPQG